MEEGLNKRYKDRSISFLSINLVTPALAELIIFTHEFVMEVLLHGDFGHSEIQTLLLFVLQREGRYVVLLMCRQVLLFLRGD